jgi:hypothetical protein
LWFPRPNAQQIVLCCLRPQPIPPFQPQLPSNPVKPRQTASNRVKRGPPWWSALPIKVNQGKSRQIKVNQGKMESFLESTVAQVGILRKTRRNGGVFGTWPSRTHKKRTPRISGFPMRGKVLCYCQ